MAFGLFIATAFSAFVLAMALLRGSMVYEEMGGLRTWEIILFYYGAALMGGTVHGLLRPVQDRYWGKFFTAYLLLYLVYGGGTIVFWPMIGQQADEQHALPLRFMLQAWAVLCLLLAPIYVKIVED